MKEDLRAQKERDRNVLTEERLRRVVALSLISGGLESAVAAKDRSQIIASAMYALSQEAQVRLDPVVSAKQVDEFLQAYEEVKDLLPFKGDEVPDWADARYLRELAQYEKQYPSSRADQAAPRVPRDAPALPKATLMRPSLMHISEPTRPY